MSGLTVTGLVIKRLPEILDDIIASEQANIDSDISVEDDELLGQLNQIVAAALAEVWELAESVNDNFNVDDAEGLNLDDLGAIFGITRIAESKSFGDQTFVGVDGTILAQGSVVRNPITVDDFQTTTQVTISVESCLAAKYSVTSVENSTLYRITINSTNHDFTSDSDLQNQKF